MTAVIDENNLPSQWPWCPFRTDFWSAGPKVEWVPDAYIASLNSKYMLCVNAIITQEKLPMQDRLVTINWFKHEFLQGVTFTRDFRKQDLTGGEKV